MQIGMIGLGRMGSNMVQRLVRGGHDCVVFDRTAAAVEAAGTHGAITSVSALDLLAKLQRPRAICLMVPAAAVDPVVDHLLPHLDKDDVIIDGGNSHYEDDISRAARLSARGVQYVDMGTSGGIWGLERGYCLMIGGDQATVERLDPIFRTLAPGPADATRRREQPERTAELGYVHCGRVGAGHFVKMVHNGIEYGLMAAYAEGFNILKRANLGTIEHQVDAETTPLRNRESYRYDFNLADVAEVWRHGSVITSWLLDLTARALAADPNLSRFGGTVSDSGEGRWTVQAANDLGVPAHVLTAALFERFASRGLDGFQNQILSAMRLGFGGHEENR
jgi:6-phosphogluconate dehydrogenase